MILESRFWFVAVPTINRSAFRRFERNLAGLSTFRARCIEHGPVFTLESHLFTYFISPEKSGSFDSFILLSVLISFDIIQFKELDYLILLCANVVFKCAPLKLPK